MKVDFIVVRHGASGAPELIAKAVKAHVINAGDGSHEHPTQGLLDIFTVLEKKRKIQGLKVVIVGISFIHGGPVQFVGVNETGGSRDCLWTGDIDSSGSSGDLWFWGVGIN
jgi:hypothetical protein